MSPILPGRVRYEARIKLSTREGKGGGEDEGHGEGDAEGEAGMVGICAPGEGELGGACFSNDAGRGRGAGADLDDELLDRGLVAERPNDSESDAGVGFRGDFKADGVMAFGDAEGAASKAGVAASAGAAIAGDFGGDGELQFGALGKPGSGHVDADAAAGSGRGIQGLRIDDLTQGISIHPRFVPYARGFAKGQSSMGRAVKAGDRPASNCATYAEC